MGEVYRAHDRRLRRDVAIKVLPHAFSDDHDWLVRFEHEARVLASLSHPHIGSIYALEESDGSRALVLELVEGPTLADRLHHGALPIEEALVIARQIAEALEAAHARGIVHRDLKPANIKLTQDGSVKVLDFGIAKTLDGPPADPMGPPTTMTAASDAGMILGTAAYMSPEQARGQPVDSRTDVWSFGCVLFEMVAGRRPFTGGTVPDVLAAILERDPDWSDLPEGTPGAVRRLLRRCLQKNARQRLRDIGDARIELDDALGAREELAAIPTTPAWRRHVPGALAGGLVASMLLALGWQILGVRSGQGRPLVTRTSVTLPSTQELDTRAGSWPLALSPDGRRLAYVAHSAGQTHLYLRDLDTFDARPLPGTGGAHYPFFSPDGQWVAFFADGKLKRVPLHGGSPVTVCDAPTVGRGGTWGAEGTIVFDPGEAGLMQVAAGGGRPIPLTTGDATMDAGDLLWPHFLPDGRTLLATAIIDGVATLVARPAEADRWRRLGRGFQPQYLSSGHLVFHAPHVREGELQVVPLDPERLVTRGEPISVLDGVFRSQNGGGAYFAVAANGALIFAPGGHARMLVRIDRNGRRTPLTDDRRGFRMPRISPDGRQIAVTVDPRPSQIWVYDIARRSGVPLTTVGHNISPLWALDGRRIAFFSAGDIFVRAADGSSEATRLLARERAQYPDAWSKDGQFIVFASEQAARRSDIWLLPLEGEPRALVATGAHEMNAALSPDERWLAYTSDESGREEIHVRPFPNVDEGKWMVSTAGGDSAVWSPTSGELFYSNGVAVMRVPFETRASEFRAGAPELLFTGAFETGSPRFDISPDGTYFVMVEADPDARPTRIHVVLNWTGELERVAPSR